MQAQRLQEGSAVDQAVYGLLIVAGILVLANRRVRIGQLAKNNWWIILFFLYEGISFVWSDFPFISFKRWIKGSGDFVMVFVLCSDPYPARAIIATIKRSGYVLIPLSLLFANIIRTWGRVFDDWGHSYYTGVTLDKNMFGYLLFAYGLFFASAIGVCIPTGFVESRCQAYRSRMLCLVAGNGRLAHPPSKQ